MPFTSDTADGAIRETKCRVCQVPVIPFEEVCPACGAEHPTDEFLGRTLRGNISIESILGMGGMGVVYKGMETHLERPVAVKVLHSTGQLTARSIEYFMREARLLSKLRHPNLVSVLDFGQEADGTLFLVLEYIPGRSLEALLEGKESFSFKRAVGLMQQVLGALEEVHRHNIVHRDLKPGNILLEQVAGQGDFVKVLDFGIAKILHNEEHQTNLEGFKTEVGTAVGTPQYMSPEQAQGHALDGRSDIYSAGLVFYELLTEKPPQTANNIFELMMRKVGEDVEPPSSVRPEIPEELDRVCARALARDPKARYPDVASFREALSEALEQLQDKPQLARTGHRRITEVGMASVGVHPQQMTLLSIHAQVSRDDAGGTQMRKARLEAVINYLRPLIQKAGGVLSLPEEGVMQARFLDNPSGSSLVRAATLAVRIRDEAQRRLAYARLRMGLVRGQPGALAQIQARAHELVLQAGANQLLADAATCGELKSVLRVLEDKGALVLQDPRMIDSRVSHKSQVSLVSSQERHYELPGRPMQKKQLQSALRKLSQDQPGGALLLVGPEGAGKSYAVDYVRRMALAAGLPILEGHSSEYLLDRPLRPLFDLVFQAIGIEEARDVHAGRFKPERLREGLRLLGLPEQVSHDLLEQYISGTPDDPWVMFGSHGEALPYGVVRRTRHVFPFQERRLVFTSAMRQVLEKVTATGGAVIILEDLDRADACTLSCLPGLCDLSRKAPLLLIGTSSQGQVEGLQEFTDLPFDAFDDQEMQVFLQHLEQGEHTIWAEYQNTEQREHLQAAIAASEGLPLYLTRWLRRPIRQAPPSTLRELVTHQLAALPGRFRRLLLIAAVLGEYFEESVLSDLFPQSKALSTALDGAAAGGWLVRCYHEPGLWRFANPRLRRAIYKAIPQEERRRYHKNILDGLKKTNPSSRKLLLKAIHARRSAEARDTVVSHMALGDRFSLAGETARALEFYQLALKWLDNLPRPQDHDRAQGEQLTLKTADAMIQTGQGQRAVTLLHQREVHKPNNRLRAETLLVRAHAAMRDLKTAQEIGHLTLNLAPPDSVHTVELIELLADITSRNKQHSEAIAMLDQGQRTLRQARAGLPDELRHLTWRLWLTRAVFYARAGKLDEAQAALSESLQHALQSEDCPGVTQVCHALCSMALRREQPQRAAQVCRELLEHPTLRLRPGERLSILQNLGRLHSTMGQSSTAQQYFREAHQLAVATGWLEVSRNLDTPPTRGNLGRHAPTGPNS